jgi:hypothetical protein
MIHPRNASMRRRFNHTQMRDKRRKGAHGGNNIQEWSLKNLFTKPTTSFWLVKKRNISCRKND